MKNVATVVLVDERNRLLIGLRKDSHTWNLPGGGLNPGESPQEGAVRELAEEAGIAVQPQDLAYLGSVIVDRESGPITVHAFKGEVSGAVATTGSDPDFEIIEWHWAPLVGSALPGYLLGRLTYNPDIALDLAKIVYKGHQDLLPGGKADRSKPEDFDPEKLAEGTRHELEHTNDPDLAREIAMDHQSEDPDYYEKLKDIEKSEGADWLMSALGIDREVEDLFESARILCDGQPLPRSRKREKLIQNNFDPTAAALSAYGIRPDDGVLLSLNEIRNIQAASKPLMSPAPVMGDVPGGVNGTPVGVVGDGFLVYRDQEGSFWVSVPDPDGNIACFYDCVSLLGFPSLAIQAKKDPQAQNGFSLAKVLPYNYQPLSMAVKEDPGQVAALLTSYRTGGTLHALAVIDYILGMPCRSSQRTVVVDIGSSGNIPFLLLTGNEEGFCPQFDGSVSVIPAYFSFGAGDLRGLSLSETIERLPSLTNSVGLDSWWRSVHAQTEKLARILSSYGKDPSQVLARISFLRSSPFSIEKTIRQAWAMKVK